MWSGDQGLNSPPVVYAKLVHPEYGYDIESENAKKLTVGNTYLVSSISMGQSHTSVRLADVERASFSSVQFEFYDANLKPIDIFSMPEFNHYLNLYEGNNA